VGATRKKATGQGRVFGYCRVSTVQQVNEGESLDVQQRQIEGYAKMNGWTVERFFVERGVSGSRPLSEREQGGTMIRDLRPGDTVITPKLDRMFRSALDALDVMGTMKQGGIALHMIDLGGDTTGNGVSKLIFTILAAVAEAERDRTRERIAEVKADQRKRGRFLGGDAPFGWRIGEGKQLVPVPEQQKAITRMRKLRAEGKSLMAIASDLTERGHPISHMGVKRTLASAERGAT
jgi:DNA invertase Pin-like site-specific DNA recombinase